MNWPRLLLYPDPEPGGGGGPPAPAATYTKAEVDKLLQDGITAALNKRDADAKAEAEKAEAAKPSYNEDQYQKTLAFYSKNAEARERLIKELDAATGGAAGQGVQELRRELAVERAMRKYNLGEDDLDLLTAADEAGIMRQAEKLSTRLGTMTKRGESADATDDEPQGETVPPLETYSGNAALSPRDQLAKEMAAVKKGR